MKTRYSFWVETESELSSGLICWGAPALARKCRSSGRASTASCRRGSAPTDLSESSSRTATKRRHRRRASRWEASAVVDEGDHVGGRGVLVVGGHTKAARARAGSSCRTPAHRRLTRRASLVSVGAGRDLLNAGDLALQVDDQLDAVARVLDQHVVEAALPDLARPLRHLADRALREAVVHLPEPRSSR